MFTRVVALVATVVLSVAAEESDQSAAQAEAIDEQILTVTLSAPPAGKSFQEAPAAVGALLKAGWYVTQLSSLGKTADGTGFVVVLVLDHKRPSEAEHQDEIASTDPGRADPLTAAKAGEYHLKWDDGQTTTLVIGAPVGVRNPVTVTTKSMDGALAVTYPATAFIDRQGQPQIDARGEPVSGPQAEQYSPDSFAIARDGTAMTLDDNGHRNEAHVEQPDAVQGPPKAPETHVHPAPHGGTER